MMRDAVKEIILQKPIQYADKVTKLADGAHSFRAECQELKAKTDRLSALLRQAARAELYERPANRIIDDTQQVLEKALALVAKCRTNGIMKRMFTIIPAVAFRKMSICLDSSIGDVSWLLRVSTAGEDDGDKHLGLPPIAQNEPILFLIWEQIATLLNGSLDSRADAAASLVSLARDNERYGKLIIEEDGVAPLLRLIKEGRLEGQENAARAIGLLGRDPESVEQMVITGVCSVFAKVLKEGPMKVQAMVAWAISELSANHPKYQDVFAQNNVVRLIGHLAFETVQEHSKYSIYSVRANASGGANHCPAHPANGRQPHISLAGARIKGREFEDPAIKAYMKAMAARALWHLARGNSAICRSITESKALLCFAILLEKGEDEVQYNSAMALLEIAHVAEEDADLRHSAFKPTSPAARAVIDQLLRIVVKADYDHLLVPCITSLGCLSRTFRATETRIVGPLVLLLNDREGVVMREAIIALTKFVRMENFLHVNHSKAIINAGGVKDLVQLVYFGEQVLQIASLILLSYIAFHVPESEELAQVDVLSLLGWATKQAYMMLDPEVEMLLPEAKGKLEVFQSRGSRGYH